MERKSVASVKQSDTKDKTELDCCKIGIKNSCHKPPHVPELAPTASYKPSKMGVSSSEDDGITGTASDRVRHGVPGAAPPPERPMLRASCQPYRMKEMADFEEMRMKMIDESCTRKHESQLDRKKPPADPEVSHAASAPVLTDEQDGTAELSDELAFGTYPGVDEVQRTHSCPTMHTMSGEDSVGQTGDVEKVRQQRITDLLKEVFDRLLGILDIPVIVIFGIILYLVDVISDVTAAVVYFQEGHPAWGSLTVMFVVLSAASWAAVSWTWWYYDDDKGEHQKYRRIRMLMAVLLLDPLVRYGV